MKNDAPGRVLDVTRLCLRLGRPALTGIDRVERAYLRHFLADDPPLHLLWRGRLGPVLLDRAAGQSLLAWLEAPTQARTRPERLVLRQAGPAGLARYRRLRLRLRARPWRLAGPAARPRAGAWLFALGHHRVDAGLLALARRAGLKLAVMVHDAIPLDHPQWARPHAVAALQRLIAVACQADLVITPSQDSLAAARRQGLVLAPGAGALVAPLGLDPPPAADSAALARALPGLAAAAAPLFLALGTIEPRKDHALLLDLWEDLARDPPRDPAHARPTGLPVLLLVGRRGWADAALCDRLDRHPLRGHALFEVNDLSDAALAALWPRLRGLLAPSRAEGFGLPLAEAARQGLPILAGDLPVYREFLGDYPVYLPLGDLYSWRRALLGLCAPVPVPVAAVAAGAGAGQAGPPGPRLDWAGHFNRVLTTTGAA